LAFAADPRLSNLRERLRLPCSVRLRLLLRPLFAAHRPYRQVQHRRWLFKDRRLLRQLCAVLLLQTAQLFRRQCNRPLHRRQYSGRRQRPRLLLCGMRQPQGRHLNLHRVRLRLQRSSRAICRRLLPSRRRKPPEYPRRPRLAALCRVQPAPFLQSWAAQSRKLRSQITHLLQLRPAFSPLSNARLCRRSRAGRRRHQCLVAPRSRSAEHSQGQCHRYLLAALLESRRRLSLPTPSACRRLSVPASAADRH
jgi:hypothetical protein